MRQCFSAFTTNRSFSRALQQPLIEKKQRRDIFFTFVSHSYSQVYKQKVTPAGSKPLLSKINHVCSSKSSPWSCWCVGVSALSKKMLPSSRKKKFLWQKLCCAAYLLMKCSNRLKQEFEMSLGFLYYYILVTKLTSLFQWCMKLWLFPGNDSWLCLLLKEK